MKKNVKAIITVLCVAMLAMLTACGGNATDKAIKDWVDNSLPKVEQANADLQAAAAEANGDRDAIIAATLEFRDVVDEVVSALAAIDLSGASADMKSTAEEHLADLQSQLATLNETLDNAGISYDGSGGVESDDDETYVEVEYDDEDYDDEDYDDEDYDDEDYDDEDYDDEDYDDEE